MYLTYFLNWFFAGRFYENTTLFKVFSIHKKNNIKQTCRFLYVTVAKNYVNDINIIYLREKTFFRLNCNNSKYKKYKKYKTIITFEIIKNINYKRK